MNSHPSRADPVGVYSAALGVHADIARVAKIAMIAGLPTGNTRTSRGVFDHTEIGTPGPPPLGFGTTVKLPLRSATGAISGGISPGERILAMPKPDLNDRRPCAIV
jgi:hypothetical protein